MVTNYNGTTLPDKYNLNLFIYEFQKKKKLIYLLRSGAI